MALFGANGIGVDLGSAYTSVYIPGEGIVLREPTRVLVSAKNPQNVLAVGLEARAMQGRASEEIEIIDPISGGTVGDIEMTALVLVALAEKATERKKALDKNLLVTGIVSGATRVEKAALFQAMSVTGARRMAAVKMGVSAALGAGLDISKPKGVMNIVLGGGCTEINVLSMNSVVATRLIRSGGQFADEAIVRWFWREKGIIIGLRTAEQLKKELGTAVEEDSSEEPVLLKGRDAASGQPASVEITQQDVRRALEGSFTYLIDVMKNAIYNMPPELASDILDQGIFLSGGGALLNGLPDRLSRETGVNVHVSEHPEDDVALGIGCVASDDKLLQALIQSGAADDVG